MILTGSIPSIEKTNLYRAVVGQLLVKTAADASGTDIVRILWLLAFGPGEIKRYLLERQVLLLMSQSISIPFSRNGSQRV
jgi:hypothetical protein